MRPVNPFHVYPVYSMDNDLSLLGYYSVPTYRTMSLQFLRSGTATVSTFDLVTIDGTVLSQDTSEVSTYAIAGGETFYSTQGSTLSNPPSNGTMYRPRITLTGGAVYWGHKCCANAIFDIAYPSLRITGCASGVVTLDATYPTGANVQIKIEDDNSSYFESLDPSAATFTATDLTASGGSFSAVITITSYVYSPQAGSREVSVTYPFTATLVDVCGTAALGSGVQSGLEDINTFELTIYNANDIQSQGILYSQGFRQKMWFSGFFGQPQPQINENYLENGEGNLSFQSARTGEGQVLEFWPCPDRAAMGLPFAKYNSNIILSGAGSSSTLYQMEFEAAEVENEDRPKGRITALFDGAFVQSIVSNYESA